MIVSSVSCSPNIISRMTTTQVSPPSAEIVGNLFVSQYYQILHESPELVYKFYHDSSVLTRPDSNGEMITTTTMKGIHKKIMSMDYLNYEADITTADSQKSYKYGVFILVTGYLRSKDDYRRKFTQSFFLAPQRNGYYIKNDIFQFVEDMKPPISHPGNRKESKTASTEHPESSSPEGLTPDTQSHANAKNLDVADNGNFVVDDVATINEVPTCSKIDVGTSTLSMPGSSILEEKALKHSYTSSSTKDVGTSTVSTSGSIIVEENSPKHPYASSTKKDVGTSTISISGSFIVEANAPKHPSPSSSKKDVSTSTVSEFGSFAAEEIALKESYTSILSSPPRIYNFEEARRMSGSEKRESHLCVDHLKLPLVKTLKQPGGPITSSSSLHGSPNSPCDKVDHHSIYVRNLPVNVTTTQLEHTFEKFGAIKKGGVQVKRHKHLKHCFGFVEFESMASVNDAMQASPISIGGQEVVVEIRKTTKVGGGKAWVPPGRGLLKQDSFRMYEKLSVGRGKNIFSTDHSGWGNNGLSGRDTH